MHDLPSLGELAASLRQIADQLDSQFVEGFHSAPTWRFKDERDPVSEVDLAIETEARRLLANRWPDIPIVGEEEGGHLPAAGPVWLLDPIDGTANFLNGIPLCAVSIGLAVDGVPAYGVVSAPLLGQRFSGGPLAREASENGDPIAPADFTSLRDSVISLGDYSTGKGAAKNPRKLAVHARIAAEAYRIRMIGSAALDLAWAASGRTGGTVILSNNPWDMCAGVAIALGAGARVVGDRGESYTLGSKAVIASPAAMSETLLGIVEAAGPRVTELG